MFDWSGVYLELIVSRWILLLLPFCFYSSELPFPQQFLLLNLKKTNSRRNCIGHLNWLIVTLPITAEAILLFILLSALRYHHTLLKCLRGRSQWKNYGPEITAIITEAVKVSTVQFFISVAVVAVIVQRNFFVAKLAMFFVEVWN